MERTAVEAVKSVLTLGTVKQYQADAISSLLRGKDCFISQPTGSGKSAVYQLFPFAYDVFQLLPLSDVEFESKTRDIVRFKCTKSKILVLQPLISLMHDQTIKLETVGIKVCRLHSNCEGRSAISAEDIEKSLEDCSIILASPEAVLNTHRILLRRKDIRENIKCLAIDEGHCIVKWGSSSLQAKAFRSDYFKIAELRSILSGQDKMPVAVLTATATPQVEKIIRENLQMNDVTRVISPPDRSNIRYSIVRIRDHDYQPFSWLIDELQEKGYCARRVIIFCKSHAHCRSLYRKFHISLKTYYSSYKDRPYAMFHAGTDDGIKSFIIDSFTNEIGTVRVLFATTAFGMGVDCKGLNLVVHYGPPNDIDDYVQESGRAGRDNAKSHAVLLSFRRCTSGNVSKAMKDYVANTTVCRRKILLQCFNAQACSDIPKEECCDVCSTNSYEILSPFEKIDPGILLQKKGMKNTSQSNQSLTQERKSVLKKKLIELRNLSMEGCSNYAVGPDIFTGIPLLAIEQTIEKAHLIPNEQSIWKETCILDTKLSTRVVEIIEEVKTKYHDESAESVKCEASAEEILDLTNFKIVKMNQAANVRTNFVAVDIVRNSD